MYIQIHEDVKCSACGALNQHERVFRNSSQYIRCTRCKHEKCISVTTAAGSGGTSIYTTPPKITPTEF